ncbi:MAG: hypothetical protein RH917_08660 [Lacipirellulaceae bacterium]
MNLAIRAILPCFLFYYLAKQVVRGRLLGLQQFREQCKATLIAEEYYLSPQ